MKRVPGIIFGLVYLIFLAGSLIVLLKPGASIFYAKQEIDAHKLTPAGNALAYSFAVNTHFYNPKSVLVLEDGRVLTNTSTNDLLTIGAQGSFAIKNIDENLVTLLFIPTGPSASSTGEHTYWVYIRPYLVSSNSAGLIFLVLALGVAVFVASSLADPEKRKLLVASPLGVVELWGKFFDRSARASQPGILRRSFKPDLGLIGRSAVITFLVAFLYVLMEWIFYITKPSFMDLLAVGIKIQILLLTGVVAGLLSLLTVILIAVLDVPLSYFFPPFRRYAFYFPAALLVACLALILLDNFTYTVLHFGIVDSQTLVRALYGLGFFGGLVYFLKQLAAVARNRRLDRMAATAVGALTVAALILVLFTFNNTGNTVAQIGQISTRGNKPNIIVFGTDGLNADNMSAYGYDRNTTPFIAQWARYSLISQNNFSNACCSLGSDTATLTGKSPLTTRVLYAPDILRGVDQYQHLPGILKTNGYRTVFLGAPYYDDVNTINFQHAFDAVDCLQNQASIFNRLSGYGFYEEAYFLATLGGRIRDRLEHIFFIQDMVNPFVQVTQSETQSRSDQDRMQCLLAELDRAKTSGKPLYVQVHLEATHGGKFYPSNQVFSKGETQDERWMTDWYDDAILGYDARVKELVQVLKENGQYDNSILILYTDHPQQWTTTGRIPLILHFPHDEYAGSISQNTQNIDMAPTILDYLKIDQPAWMAGSSVLKKLDPNRLILDPSALSIILNAEGMNFIPPELNKPPFYQFGSLTAIQCQNWFTFDLQNRSISQGTVAHYVNPCPAGSLDSLDGIRKKVGDILKQNGFDVPKNW